MRISIIEDEKVHRDLLVSYIDEWKISNRIETDVRQYESAEQFLFDYDVDNNFDVLFIDIQMSGMNGVELSKLIREKDKNIVIIFTTGILDYIQEGYEVEAMHYLLKPLNKEKVHHCLERVEKRKNKDSFVLVHMDDETIKMNIEEINYIEARAHRCVVGKSNGETLEIKESITEMESLLEGEEFIKCHRSYLCRIGSVYKIDKTDIYFDNGSNIPVSRRMYTLVNKAFIKYFRR